MVMATTSAAAAMTAMAMATTTTTMAMATILIFFAWATAAATRADVTGGCLAGSLFLSTPRNGTLRDRQGQVSRIQMAPRDAAADDDAFPRACSRGSTLACPCTARRCRRQCTTPRRNNGAYSRAWQLFPL